MMGTEPIPAAELAAMRARCEAATEGPWVTTTASSAFHRNANALRVETERHVSNYWRTDENYDCVPAGEPITWSDGEEAVADEGNATFIAHARTDLPAALDEIERLRREVNELRATINEPYEDWGKAPVTTPSLPLDPEVRDDPV